MAAQTITIKTTIHADRETVWERYTAPEHITQWNHASDDWHSPRAENDVREGGTFSIRMEAKDGSSGFDFAGTYDEVRPGELLAYTMDDGRKVEVAFSGEESTDVTITFEAEGTYPIEAQRDGWQAILENFKRYVEAAAPDN